jgi:hypothetical protein
MALPSLASGLPLRADVLGIRCDGAREIRALARRMEGDRRILRCNPFFKGGIDLP